MPGPSTLALLRLTLVEGVGPILGRRLLRAFPTPESIFDAAPVDLERVEGIGSAKARRIFESIKQSADALAREADLALKLNVRILSIHDPDYPPLLLEAADAPLVLYVRGATPCPADAFPVGIVGSRHCTAYGVEQSERFAAMLAEQGLVIVSGGARGVDSAAHRAALRVGGATVVVMGCGLGSCYPPENAPLFDDIASRGGSIVSEIPLSVGPSAENFPARNRIIAAMSLGVLVIEAPRGSGALITARVAIDDYNREVFAVPGRIDSRASEGSNDLIKKGEAALVTAPADIIEALESAARHFHQGTHEPRFAPASESDAPPALFQSDRTAPATAATLASRPSPMYAYTPVQQKILEALAEPRSTDQLCRLTGIEPGVIQAETAILEIRRAIVRQGSSLVRRQTN